jgi:hypothetical protein
VQYRQPPITIDGEAIGLGDALGFRVRFKLYDYGVISVRCRVPCHRHGLSSSIGH